MKLGFPWQRRPSQNLGSPTSPPSTSPHRSLSPLRLPFARQAKVSSPRRPSEEEPASPDPTGRKAAFAAASGGASTVDESTLRALLMRQPAAQALGLTDETLMQSFVCSCAVGKVPAQGSPKSVVWSAVRYTCAQYMSMVADLSSYRRDVQRGTLIIGNGRSVLHSNAGGLVDNYGSVLRFNDYKTEGPLTHAAGPLPQPRPTYTQPTPCHSSLRLPPPVLRATPTPLPSRVSGFAKHVGTKTTLWVLSDWVCIKLINKYPERRVPILVCIPFTFMGKPYYDTRRAEARYLPPPPPLSP